MRVINKITDKPEWDREVFDEQPTSKWFGDITKSGEDITPRMMDWVIKELQWKADLFRKLGQTVAFGPGVVKSDIQTSNRLHKALKEAVSALEVEEKTDNHRLDQTVINLIDPSIFPVVFGRSRILPDQIIGIENYLDKRFGVQLPTPPVKETKVIAMFEDNNTTIYTKGTP